VRHELIGSSAAIERLRRDIALAAISDAKVLITGESGSGKEVVVRALHGQGSRRARPLVSVNCAGVPETLLESSFFGHVRGSFTGALYHRQGLLRAAHEGTVFLDEVGDMPLRMQSLLLRFLESGEIQRLGEERPTTRVDVRVIAATNRELASEVTTGAFRLDLFYRLNVIHLKVPPLRARPDDVVPLFEHFLGRLCRQHAAPRPELSTEAVAALTHYHWPGNVRELQSVAERVALAGRQPVIDRSSIARHITGSGVTSDALPRPGPSSAAVLLDRVAVRGESFWKVVRDPFMSRDMTRQCLTSFVRLGLERAGGSYDGFARLLNMDRREGRRLVAFLKQHRCYVAGCDLRATA
jgi:DNA-binding NtrC family response regulator